MCHRCQFQTNKTVQMVCEISVIRVVWVGKKKPCCSRARRTSRADCLRPVRLCCRGKGTAQDSADCSRIFHTSHFSVQLGSVCTVCALSSLNAISVPRCKRSLRLSENTVVRASYLKLAAPSHASRDLQCYW